MEFVTGGHLCFINTSCFNIHFIYPYSKIVISNSFIPRIERSCHLSTSVTTPWICMKQFTVMLPNMSSSTTVCIYRFYSRKFIYFWIMKTFFYQFMYIQETQIIYNSYTKASQYTFLVVKGDWRGRSFGWGQKNRGLTLCVAVDVSTLLKCAERKAQKNILQPFTENGEDSVCEKFSKGL
jgi:hypothetical protein